MEQQSPQPMQTSPQVPVNNQTPAPMIPTPGTAKIPSQPGKNSVPHSATLPQIEQFQSEASDEILSRRKLQDLLNQVAANERLDPEVEELFLEIADDFVENVTTFACNLAKHRNSSTLEVKDIQLHLETNWGIKIPGFGSETKKPVQKDQEALSIHQQRMDLIHTNNNKKK